MIFSKYYKDNKIKKWKEYYVDYKKLKHIIKYNDDFYNQIMPEINKLNEFIKIIDSEEDKISYFFVINYMALFKAIQKHDKKLSKSIKMNFFNKIHNTEIYNYYLNIPRKSSKIKLVIFDKDGTLVRIDNMFGKILVDIVNNLSYLINDKEGLYKYLGYDHQNNKFDFDSVVAKGTNDDIKNSIIEFIKKENSIDVYKIKVELDKYWKLSNINEIDIVECGNIKRVFSYLKNKNIKIAVCTSDDRAITLDIIKYLNLSEYVEEIRCGDDHLSSKPSPEPIWDICRNLNIDVSNTLMIGDTISDIHAGINAKCGKVVGVLSGGYNNTELGKADHILDSIDDLVKIIKN
jgi:phosphoglycolate phosphatase